MRRLGWGRQVAGEELEMLEMRLRNTLQPVTPRPGFVKDLRRKLVSYPAPSVEPDSRMTQTVLVAVASLLSGALLLAMGVRAMLALVGALGAYAQFRRAGKQSPSSARPAI